MKVMFSCFIGSCTARNLCIYILRGRWSSQGKHSFPRKVQTFLRIFVLHYFKSLETNTYEKILFSLFFYRYQLLIFFTFLN